MTHTTTTHRRRKPANPGPDGDRRAHLLAQLEQGVSPLVSTRPRVETPASHAIARPRVPVRRLEDGKVLAECRHCDWTLPGAFPAEIELYVTAHREAHRTGDVRATR